MKEWLKFVNNFFKISYFGEDYSKNQHCRSKASEESFTFTEFLAQRMVRIC